MYYELIFNSTYNNLKEAIKIAISQVQNQLFTIKIISRVQN